MVQKIPKVIHYCWFGGNEKPQLILKCIDSWKKYCPDYEIHEWNEENYNIRKIKYISEAYDNKRWAFVSDYARLDIIFEHGGIYLDTDVEIIKPLDSLLYHDAIMGFEDGKNIATGLICAAKPKHKAIKELRDIYNNIQFIKSDGSLNLTPCPQYSTEYFKKNGLKQNDTLQICNDVTIFPSEYFNPVNLLSQSGNITDHSYAIHHAAMSWHDSKTKKALEKERYIYSKYGKNVWRIYHGIDVLYRYGPRELLKRIMSLILK